MWRTLTGLPLLMLLLSKYTIPLTVYVLDIKFRRLSFLQLYAILLFIEVRFSLINTSLVRPNVDVSIDFSFFHIIKCLFDKLSIRKTDNCFFGATSVFPNSMTSLDVIRFYVHTKTGEYRNNFFF